MAILAVLAVYNTKIKDSKTAQSLVKACNYKPQAFKTFKLVVYDNSPCRQVQCLEMPFQCEYKHDPNNNGLAGAYNYALDRAIDGNYDWILLLDHDTVLQEDFLFRLVSVSLDVQDNDNVAAIVPKAFYNGRFFSPSKVLFGGVHRPIDINHTGICDLQVAAIGSGALVRMSFLKELGGLSRMFWLDCLDAWMFNAIYSSGRKVYVTDSIIEHELSVLSYDRFMTESRYQNILKYETIFMRSFKSKAENYFYLLRLLKRTVTLWFTVKNKRYSMMTLRHLVTLIFRSSRAKQAVPQINRL
jgi:GT2 family glycosyltransferase